MSMSCQGCHNDVTVVVHDVQHSLVIPQQACIVAGLWMQGQVTEDEDSLLLPSGSAAFRSEPLQLLLTEPATKFDETPLCLRHSSRPSWIILVLQSEDKLIHCTVQKRVMGIAEVRHKLGSKKLLSGHHKAGLHLSVAPEFCINFKMRVVKSGLSRQGWC